MQSIGLTIEEIAIIYLALPFTTFLSPPLTGKLNNELSFFVSFIYVFPCNYSKLY